MKIKKLISAFLMVSLIFSCVNAFKSNINVAYCADYFEDSLLEGYNLEITDETEKMKKDDIELFRKFCTCVIKQALTILGLEYKDLEIEAIKINIKENSNITYNFKGGELFIDLPFDSKLKMPVVIVNYLIFSNFTETLNTLDVVKDVVKAISCIIYESEDIKKICEGKVFYNFEEKVLNLANLFKENPSATRKWFADLASTGSFDIKRLSKFIDEDQED